MDLLGELFSFPWAYRGWMYLLSAAYRHERHQVWNKSPFWLVLFDVAFSLLVAAFELLVVFVVIKYLLNI
jgi:hypothetical protein